MTQKSNKYIDNDYRRKMDKNSSWAIQLQSVLDEYTEHSWQTDPLTKEEVDSLCNIIKIKLNLYNKNITEEEYDNFIECLHAPQEV